MKNIATFVKLDSLAICCSTTAKRLHQCKQILAFHNLSPIVPLWSLTTFTKISTHISEHHLQSIDNYKKCGTRLKLKNFSLLQGKNLFRMLVSNQKDK